MYINYIQNRYVSKRESGLVALQYFASTLYRYRIYTYSHPKWIQLSQCRWKWN